MSVETLRSLRSSIPQLLKLIDKHKVMKVVDQLAADSAVTLKVWKNFIYDYEQYEAESRDMKHLCRKLLLLVLEGDIDVGLFQRALMKTGQHQAAEFVQNQVEQDDLKLSIQEVNTC